MVDAVVEEALHLALSIQEKGRYSCFQLVGAAELEMKIDGALYGYRGLWIEACSTRCLRNMNPYCISSEIRILNLTLLAGKPEL